MKLLRPALICAFSATLVTTSCQSGYTPPSTKSHSTLDDCKDHNHLGYTGAQSGSDLGRALDRDLQAGEGATAFCGLEQFVQDHLLARSATWAHSVLKEVRPVTRFQFANQSRYLVGVKELEVRLAREAGTDLSSAYTAARHRDYARLRSMLESKQGLLHPETVAMDSELRPHAALFASLVAYDEFSRNPEASIEDVNRLFSGLAQAREELGQSHSSEGMFMADVAWAQALEQQGDHDAAGEIWLRITKSNYWTQTPVPVRNAIAARITSYTARLRNALAVQLENERRAELAFQALAYEAKANVISTQQQELAGQVARDRHEAQTGLQDLQVQYARYQEHTASLETKHSAFSAWAIQANNDTQAELERLKDQDTTLEKSLEEMVYLNGPPSDATSQAKPAIDVLSWFADSATAASALSRFLPKRLRFRL
ncbi:MAG: hypothetical protein JKY61_05945 [Planctomycetes bacterium]|nr:hypothetical protein [Planctomycetota bacterium]